MNENESAWFAVHSKVEQGVLVQVVVPREAVEAVREGGVPSIVGTAQVLITRDQP